MSKPRPGPPFLLALLIGCGTQLPDRLPSVGELRVSAACPTNFDRFVAEAAPARRLSFAQDVLPIFIVPLPEQGTPCLACHNRNDEARAGGLTLGGSGVKALDVYQELVAEEAQDPALADGSADGSPSSAPRRISCDRPERSLIALEPTIGEAPSLRPHPAGGKSFRGLRDPFVGRIIEWVRQGALFN